VSALPIVSIVDDDESIRFATASLVRSLGWGARMFASATALLESADIENSACIISDLHMPGMTGVEMQAILLARSIAVPILFITAFPSDEIRRTALADGAIGFLHKPLDVYELVACLKGILQRS
jgi:FixJ family two-component response regulator